MSELLAINVNEHTEKKNGLTYLSWAWAWAEVLKIDPRATWEAQEFDGRPFIVLPGDTVMVKVTVTIKSHAKSCWLPVMDHRNKAIKAPDAFAINTAIVRCLVKAIAMHGLGLYIYAGEDLPEGEEPEPKKPEPNKKLEGVQISPTRETAAATPITSEEASYVMDVGGEMVAAFGSGREMDALKLWRGISDNDIKIHLWNWLQSESKLRSFLKANKE